MRVADFQRELEAYTGQSWEQFFKDWVYGSGLTDWKVERVQTRIQEPLPPAPPRSGEGDGIRPLPASGTGLGGGFLHRSRYTVTVLLKQQAQIDEPTTLGFQFADGDNYPDPRAGRPAGRGARTRGPAGRVEALPDHRVRVTVDLPQKPVQIAVDPDQVIEDVDPANNYWKPRERWRWTPLYTQLEETDLMNDYDRWNFIVGPWVYASATQDPWFQRPSYLGVRAGAYRTQEFDGGVYAALRSDYRDLVVGTDGLIDHWPFCKTQIGYVVEERVAGPIGATGRTTRFRAVVYGRYIFQYTSAMYLNPMNYARSVRHLPGQPAAVRPHSSSRGPSGPDRIVAGGLHYHLDYTTPYWDPEAGFRFDATYTGGMTSAADQRRRAAAQARIAVHLHHDAAGGAGLLLRHAGGDAGVGRRVVPGRGRAVRPGRGDAVPRLRPRRAAGQLPVGRQRRVAAAGAAAGLLGRLPITWPACGTCGSPRSTTSARFTRTAIRSTAWPTPWASACGRTWRGSASSSGRWCASTRPRR